MPGHQNDAPPWSQSQIGLNLRAILGNMRDMQRLEELRIRGVLTTPDVPTTGAVNGQMPDGIERELIQCGKSNTELLRWRWGHNFTKKNADKWLVALQWLEIP